MPFPLSQIAEDTINIGFAQPAAPSYIPTYGNDGTARYIPLDDVSTSTSSTNPTTNQKIRMYYTVNNGTAWNELHSAGAPSIPDNNTGTSTRKVYAFYHSCYDTTNNKIFVAHFNSSYHISITPFHINTATPSAGTWASNSDSGQGYLDAEYNDQISISGLVCEYRASDDSVWVIWEDTNLATQTLSSTAYIGAPTQIWGMRYSVAGNSWGTAVVLATDSTIPTIWRPLAMRNDNSGRNHIWAQKVPYQLNTVGTRTEIGFGTNNPLVHFCITSGNTVGATSTIQDSTPHGYPPFGINYPEMYVTTGVSTIGFSYVHGNPSLGTASSSIIIGRGVGDTDSPTWTLETLTQINNLSGRIPGGFVRYSGADYYIWSYFPSGDDVITHYIFSTGLGGSWSALNTVGTFTPGTGSLYMGIRVCAWPYEVSSSIGINFPYGTYWGEGYYEFLPSGTSTATGASIFIIPKYIHSFTRP